MTSEGKRQITSFYVPGDTPDLQSLHLRRLDHTLGTITGATVGFMRHEAVWELCQNYPRLTRALWRDTLIDASIHREWVVNVGRRPAHTRLAHIFCEMLVRLRAVGLADDHSCDLPITQSEYADATGLSAVHVNRTIQQLRAEGLIELTGSRLTVLDWDKLREVGDFDPVYLHLEDGRAAA